jgi:hypothetical protein
MRDVRPAEFVRWVGEDEPLDEVVNDARAATWVHQREHALLQTHHGLAIVSGGRDGIELKRREDGSVILEIEGTVDVVVAVAWHTHPIATGPSDADREVLMILGQRESLIFEPGSGKSGLRFYGHTKGRPT